MRRLPTLIALSLTLVGCRSYDFERMQEQPRYDAYQDSRVFQDGKVLQSPPEGTVPREPALISAALHDGMEDSVYVRDFPLDVDAELLARGRERFDIFCAACHGLRGDGATIVASAMRLRRPPSLHLPRIRDYPPGRIYRIARTGYGLMPSYADELSVRDTWAVVAYVRALQLSQHAPLDSLPPEIRDEAVRRLRGASPSAGGDR
jgi:mono/diheme cytochrome c family protein